MLRIYDYHGGESGDSETTQKEVEEEGPEINEANLQLQSWQRTSDELPKMVHPYAPRTHLRR